MPMNKALVREIGAMVENHLDALEKRCKMGKQVLTSYGPKVKPEKSVPFYAFIEEPVLPFCAFIEEPVLPVYAFIDEPETNDCLTVTIDGSKRTNY